MALISEAAIREIVAEVVTKLGSSGPAAALTAVPAVRTAAPGLRGRFGVFQDVNEACTAAHEAYLQLVDKGVNARRKIVEIVKALADSNAERWGRLGLEETEIGRRDHQIA